MYKITTLFIILKRWKQPKCPITEICLNKVVAYSLDQKKKWNTDTYYNIDNLWRWHAEWRKPVTKDYISYNFLYMKCPDQANLWRHKVAVWLLPAGGRRVVRWVIAKMHGIPFWDDKNVLKLTVMMVVRMYLWIYQKSFYRTL